MTRRDPAVAVVGAGMSGLCVAIALLRSGITDVTIYEKADEVGGTWRDNTYPGLVCDIPSRIYQYSFARNPDWSHLFSPGGEIQAYFRDVADRYALRERIRFGTEIVLDDVVSVDLKGDVKTVTLGSGAVHQALAVIFATGSAYRKLGLEDEERLSGHGVSWCATCDGFFFRERTIAGVGGGDSAMEEATFLTRFADKVYVIHRRDSLRASKIMQERAFANDKIEFVWNSEVVGINGDEQVRSITLRNLETDEQSELEIQGLFIAIGNDPRVHLVHGQLDLTSDGTIAVAGRSSKTKVAGVFAAGDVIDPSYRQAVTAAASGTVAALDAEHYLTTLPKDLLDAASDGASGDLELTTTA